jgi:hypothetical protein
VCNAGDMALRPLPDAPVGALAWLLVMVGRPARMHDGLLMSALHRLHAHMHLDSPVRVATHNANILLVTCRVFVVESKLVWKRAYRLLPASLH